MIRCVVFDFDGTLVDSNRIKRESLFAVVESIAAGRDIMGQILSAPDRGDRYAVFERFAGMAGLPSGSGGKLAQEYSDRCRTLIAACPEMPGAEAAMEALYARQCRLFINSATPEIDLRPIVQTRGFSRLLAGIFGGPATKAGNLHRILTLSGAPPRDLVVVGDGSDDREAADQIGCLFVPVFDSPIEATRHAAALADLATLPSLILALENKATARMRK